MNVTHRSDATEKVLLFRSLFRGREDVCARRFESQKTGRGGYAPLCRNEWVRGICEKPRIKCAICLNRDFVTVGEAEIRWHLIGRDSHKKPFVMGLYPMLLDESCWFLAVDLDKAGWQNDALALVSVCKKLQIPIALERSRSGNGAHLWIFFKEPVPAVLARKLGTHLLTLTMNERPDLGFSSYDRLFPNQDTLPKGGFGNLIALPLQGAAREKGNSVFIDEALLPYADQWAFLSSVRKLSKAEVDKRVQSAERKGTVLGVRPVPEEAFALEPWKAPASRRAESTVTGPLPERIEFVIADQIYLPRGQLTPSLCNCLLQMAAFQNPEFYKAQAMRLPTYDKPRIICCAEEHEAHLALPRGCLDEVTSLFRSLGIRYRRKDKRFKGVPLSLRFKGVLRDDQQEAALALCKHDTGVLAATTAFGKTVLAAWMIAERGVNTLILVHRRQLMDQWVLRLTEFLDIEEKEIGRLGGGRRKLKGRVDIAILQSVVRKGEVDDRVADYGQVIVDECHHVSARNFELAVRRCKAKYILGLSATVTRKDGHHPIIFMQCGPVRHRVEAKMHGDTSALLRQVMVRPTQFRFLQMDLEDSRLDFTAVMDSLIRDERRNRMICADIKNEMAVRGSVPLVLTERTEHLDLLSEILIEQGVDVVVIRGGMNKSELSLALEKLEERRATALLATGRFVGEGFDHARLDTLFLTMPVSWKGTVAQYVGRLHRRHEGKEKVRVFDYADLNQAMLGRMFDRRCREYERLGYSILLPASALPGWPIEVPLPVDAGWKRKYAGSVQRLIRDGVDVPLAELFAEVTEFCELGDLKGEDRARSASEAFLYRRLQSMDKTRDRFKLNAELLIPFAGFGRMEVDFLDEKHKLVLELDGPHHFQDKDAYRRDRLKDARLQERGYRVLRFLSEDLGTHLNHVLDEVLRALAKEIR